MKDQIYKVHDNFLNCSSAWKAILNFKLDSDIKCNTEVQIIKEVFYSLDITNFFSFKNVLNTLESCFRESISISIVRQLKEEMRRNSDYYQTYYQLFVSLKTIINRLEKHTSLTTKMFEEEYTDAKLIISKRIIELRLNQLDKNIENHHQLMKDRLEKLTNWVYYLHEGGQLENPEDIDNAMDSFLLKFKEFFDSPITVMPLFCIVNDAMHNFINMKNKCIMEKRITNLNLNVKFIF